MIESLERMHGRFLWGAVINMNRRQFIGVTGLSGLGASLAGWHLASQPGENEVIARKLDQQLLGEDYPYTALWGFNDSVPGPVLRKTQGDTLSLTFKNRLSQPSSIHWHGIRLPNNMDGVPGITQRVVKPGEDFQYEFALPDAGTFWYHPHVATYEQLGRGLYGALIVGERERVDVDRDELLVISDLHLDQSAQIPGNFKNLHDASHAGRLGNTVLCNGQKVPTLRQVRPGERIRLRLVNASSARIYRLRFDGVAPLIVAMDGHPCAPQIMGETLYFSPGNRYDFILDVPRLSGGLTLRDEFFPMMPNLLARFELKGSPVAARSGFAGLPPNTLPPFDDRSAEKVDLVLEGGALSEKATREAIWLLNGRGNDHDSLLDSHENHPDPLFECRSGQTIHCRIDNRTAWFHPMHFHGVVLQEKQADGRWGPYRDATLVWPFKTSEIRFVTERPGEWMIHCHVSEHHHSGLMGTFRVGDVCTTKQRPWVTTAWGSDTTA